MTTGQEREDSAKTEFVEDKKKRNPDDFVTAQKTENKKETDEIERLKKKSTSI